MTDDIIPTPADQAAKPPIPPVVDAGDDEPDAPQKSYTQEEHERAIQKRLKKMAKEKDALAAKTADYDALKKDADEYRKLKDSQKSEVQRLADEKLAIEARAQKAEADYKSLQVDLLRHKLSANSPLPPEWWEDVKGDTEAEIKASITALSKKLKLDKQRVGGPTPAGGQRVADPNADVNARIYSFVGGGSR